MIKSEDKVLKRIYIEETLRSRKYFGYRLDLVLIKLIITAFITLSVYISTGEFIFTIIIISEVFILITLINKLIVDRKAKKGKMIFIENMKMKKFKKRVFSTNDEEMDNFIFLYLNLNRYYEIKKVGSFLYRAKKNDTFYYVSIIKLFNGAIVEKIDIRNIVTSALADNAENLIILTANEFDDEVNDLIKNVDALININIVNFNDLFKFVKENSLLSTAYDIVSIDDIERKNKINIIEIISNIMHPGKIKVYIIAAFAFYTLQKILIINTFCVYMSYYFLFMGVADIIFNFYKSFINKRNQKNI